MALPSGTRLGPYEILSALGAGGMGEVYKARDTRLARTVAIKVLPADTATDAAARARFEREARAIAALSHPHICVVHDVGHQDPSTGSGPGIDYLVMELLDGETLAERLARAKGPLPLDEVLRIGTAIADALDKAHRAGIVHRDLKPLNVMLTKSGPKLLDFGLAKLHGSASPVSLSNETAATTAGPGTAKGTILGTIHYMAPEQVEGRDADTRSDIWALGALLYEMATGQRPFKGESAASVIGAIMQGTPVALSARQPLTPPAFEHVVERCLAKDPDERWQTAGDVKRELQWVATRRQDVAAPQSAPQPPKSARAAWLVAALALGIAAIAIGLNSRGREVPTPPTSWLSIPPPAGPFGPRLGPAISPDGTTVAFWAPDTDGVYKLWLRELSQPTARPLPGTDAPQETVGSRTPTWSPDSRSLAFFSRGKLQRIDVSGGSPIALADTGGSPRGLSWGSQGTILFVPNSGGGTFTVADSGGPATSLALGPLARAAEWPSYLPDGRHFFFTPAPEQSREEDAGIYLGTVGSAETVRLLLTPRSRMQYANGRAYFVQDGSLYAQPFSLETLTLSGTVVRVAEGVGSMGGDGAAHAFSISDRGSIVYANSPFIQISQLRILDRQGRTLRAVGEATSLFGMVLAPDGRRLVIDRPPDLKNGASLWLANAETGVSSLLQRDATVAVWAPTGDRVAYRSRDSGIRVAQVANPAEAAAVPLAGFPGRPWPESWSPDGRTLLVRAEMLGTRADIWSVAVDGSVPPAPYLRTASNEEQARFSPDGRWVAYTSDESGNSEVYVQSYPQPGTAGRISTTGGSRPLWRPDGKELYYVDAAGKFIAVTVSATATSFTTEKALALFDAGALIAVGPYRDVIAVYPGGQQFLMNLAVPPKTPTAITVVQHWKPPAR